MRKDLGFDRVRVYERDAYGGFTGATGTRFSRLKTPHKTPLRNKRLKELKKAPEPKKPQKKHRSKTSERE